jgi:hypothetical protein
MHQPPKPGLLDVPTVVDRLRARGLQAKRTDEHIVSIVGGECTEVARVNGLAVGVYRYADPTKASRTFEMYAGETKSSWVAPLYFARLENLFITLATDDAALAAGIVGALEQRP